MKRILFSGGAFLIGALIIVLVLIPSLRTPKLFMTLELSGGLCATQEECSRTYYVFETGTVSGDLFHNLTDQEMEKLNQLASTTDFDNLPVMPVEERNCPSYADGADLSVKFKNFGVGDYTLCQYRTDQIELFSYIQEILKT